MISLEQLQQLREMVHTTVSRMRVLERENAELRQKLLQYEGDLDGLSQENRDLEKNQQLIETEVNELLDELQDLQSEETAAEIDSFTSQASVVADASIELEDNAVKKLEIPKVSPIDSLKFMERRGNVDPKHVSENDFENSLKRKPTAQSMPEATAAISAAAPDLAAVQSKTSQSKILNQSLGHALSEGLQQSAVSAQELTEKDEIDSNIHHRSMTEVAEELNDTSASLSGEITELEREKLSHSLDISLGLSGDSLLALEENLSALNDAQENRPHSAPNEGGLGFPETELDDDAEIF